MSTLTVFRKCHIVLRSRRHCRERLQLLPLEDRCQPASYTFDVIGQGGDSDIWLNHINNQGLVTGTLSVPGSNDPSSVVPDITSGFLWKEGAITDLGLFLPWAVNNDGDVVGVNWLPDTFPIPRILRHGTSSAVGLDFRNSDLGYGWGTTVAGITDSGQIVGNEDYLFDEGWSNPVHWVNYQSNVTDLPYSNDNSVSVKGINNNGRIIAKVRGEGGLSGNTHLGDLPGGANSTPIDINDNDEVVGRGSSSDGDRAIYWAGSTPTNLGVLPEYDWSSADAINNSGLIVGASYRSSFMGQESRAVLWQDSQHEPVDLNELIDLAALNFHLEGATDVNDLGQILAYGTVWGGKVGVILTPTNVEPDIVVDSLKWDTTNREVDFDYEVLGSGFSQNTSAEFYWSIGDRAIDILGGPIVTRDILGTSGQHSIPVSIADLKAAGSVPYNATHLLVRIDPTGQLDETNVDNNVNSLSIPLTVITHGFQAGFPFGTGDLPEWTKDMARAINGRSFGGLFEDSQIVNSVVSYNTSSSVPPPGGATSFLVFDWAAVSGFSSPGAASIVDDKLTELIQSRLPISGKRDIHFIGHSRGTYVNLWTIKSLNNATDKSKIDDLQMTTLDPEFYDNNVAPLIESAPLVVPDNVTFADNYYQVIDRLGLGSVLIDKDPFGGGVYMLAPDNLHTRLMNVDVSNVVFDWDVQHHKFPNHSKVHDWYHWTIDITDDGQPGILDPDLLMERADLISGQPKKGRDALYQKLGPVDSNGTTVDLQNGKNIGYYWSKFVGGDRAQHRKYDSDGDGVTNEIENVAPNHGDFNDDGKLDSLQDNISAIKSVVNDKYLMLRSESGIRLTGVKSVTDPSGGNLPSGFDFPFGFLEFNIEGVSPGGTATVVLESSFGTLFGFDYYKYGPASSPAWYDFTFDGSTGAQQFGDSILLSFVDGQRGDDDQTADGIIRDPGTTAVPSGIAPTATFLSDGVVAEGSHGTVRFSDQSDPLNGDAPGFRYMYDFDDDGVIDVDSGEYSSTGVGATTRVPSLDNPSRVVRGYIVTEAGGFASYVSTVEFANAPPTSTLIGSEHTDVNQAVVFDLAATDPSPVDQSYPFSFLIDWNNDGLVDQTESSLSGMSISHAFPSIGLHRVKVKAVDKDGDAGPAAELAVRVGQIFIAEGDLYVHGTSGNDRILVTRRGSTVQVRINNKFVGTFSPTGKVKVYGDKGNDYIVVGSIASLPCEIYGQGGKDTLIAGAGADFLDGGEGNDLLVGGVGNDTLLGRDGNDIENGGNGNDLLDGGVGDDYLIGGNGNDVLIGSSGFLDAMVAGNGDDSLDDIDGISLALGGNGIDAITITFAVGWNQTGNSILKAGALNGGYGDDHIRVTSNEATIQFSAYGSYGKDLIELSGVWNKVRVFGGTGFDKLDNNGISLTEFFSIELEI